MPNTTSASMVTTVMTGRLIARSEMNMLPRRSDRHRGAGADSLGRPEQKDVALVDARDDLDPFRAFVAETERHCHLFRLPIRDAKDPGLTLASVDRRERHHEPFGRGCDDATFSEQAGH